MKVIKEYFPNATAMCERGKNQGHTGANRCGFGVFFTDCFDMKKDYDKTKDEARQICRAAKDKEHYDVKKMKKCFSLDWRLMKDRIIQTHLKMRQAEFISGFDGLDNAQLDYFNERCEDYLKCIA